MASNRNEVIIEGNMTRDPILRTTHSASSVCSFGIATNRYFKKGDEFEKEVSFFEVQCWLKLAVDVADKGKKGSAIKVMGRLKQDKWTAQGEQKTKVIIVANDVKFITFGKRDSGSQETDECPF